MHSKSALCRYGGAKTEEKTVMRSLLSNMNMAQITYFNNYTVYHNT